MIKKIIIPVVAMILLSSCANKYSLIKRKYGKGYYVSVTKNNTDLTKKHEVKNTLVKVKPEQKAEINNSVSEDVAAAPSFISNSVVAKNDNYYQPKFHKPTSSKKLLDMHKFTASTINTVHKSSIKIKPLTLSNNENKLAKSDSDLNLLVMIILCLFPFINLIPVYLHDGKSITLNFWLTLILNFTYLGAVIFAILVVLDIINFA
jgi:hypothetical protein